MSIMKERPIIFTGESVRAILAGRKTQTRRIVKSQFDGESEKDWLLANGGFEKSTILRLDQWGNEIGSLAVCPYGKLGDRLWVRETWRHWQVGNPESKVVYRADFDKDPGFWKSSIHMPRWASRIVLKITGVRVERLQEISEADAQAEGVEPVYFPHDGSTLHPHFHGFKNLWDKINGKRASWESNPLVWVIEFRNHP